VNILGIWDGHDAGAALLADGHLVAAVNEERFTRRKLEIDFPSRSIATCLSLGGIRPKDVGLVATTTSDVAKALGRLVPSTKESYYQLRRRKSAPGLLAGLRSRGKYVMTEWPPNAVSRAVSRWALERNLAAAGLGHAARRLYDHHACHAAAAACASGFESCLVMTIDGVGDGKSSTVSRFKGGTLELLASTPAGHSPGVFFEHVTHLLNMRELEDEGKVMALADYAAPVPDDRNPMLGLLGVDGLRFVTAVPGHRLAKPLARILWHVPNEQFAYMAQRTLEVACSSLAANAVRQTGERRIALSGGVASNIKVNARIRRLEPVEDVFVFPHMGDGGLALGAAVLARGEHAGGPPALDLDNLALGPAYSDPEVENALRTAGLPYADCPALPATVARLLLEDKIVLWFQGRMEYGPRALGHRSVLARPDRPGLRDRLNRLLKRRVWYQPFCPSLLEADARRILADFTGRPNPHMTMAYDVRPGFRATMSGVINVDGSCRPQIVAETDGGPFAALLREMRAQLGAGVVLNTSFNMHGHPLVCTPGEAIDVFRESGADALAIGSWLVCRETNTAAGLNELGLHELETHR
jgi:carbamoyltransferase